MNAEIIAVGSELLTPQRLDTNSLFLTDQLNDLGVEVTTKYVVGDNRDHVADALRRAMSRSEIVILSGGLGPTEDDVTRDAVALAIDRRLIFHAEICDQIEQRFRQANRKMSEVNRRQAFVIEGAEVLPNDRGTAPGQWIDESETYHHSFTRSAARAEGHVHAPVPAAPRPRGSPAGHPHAGVSRRGHGRVRPRSNHLSGLQASTKTR